MKTFKAYLEEEMPAFIAQQIIEAPGNSFDIAAIKTVLGQNGYADIKDISNKKISIKTNQNRMDTLNKIVSLFPGSKYDPDITGSSIGGVKLASGVMIIAKPIGGGSGAGADITKTVESAQCLFCSARWYVNGKYDSSSLKTALSYIDVDETFDKMISLPDEWIKSMISTAEELYNKFGNKKYEFHRGSRWVNVLQTKFKQLNKIEKEFSDINKWSPADIYMVGDKKENFSDIDSIVEFNARLQKHLVNKTIIGVSLKKTDSATIKFVNLTKDKSTYQIKNPYYTTGKRGFFLSNDVYLMYQDGEVQLRTFGSSWQGEIKGKKANHGKIGGGVISNLLKKIGGKELEPFSSIKKQAQIRNETFYQKFYSYYKDVENNPIQYDKFKFYLNDKDLNWVTSKYAGCQFLSILGKNNVEQMIGSMISYASSSSDMSAPYVKVS